MRNLLIMLVIALLVVPAISQPVMVGGSYGRAWLVNNGNKNVIPQATSLWDWGQIPKGQMLVNGKLVQAGPGNLIYPAFPSSNQLLVLNETVPGTGINASNATQLSNPYLTTDAWTAAQLSERPVLERVSPY